MTSPWFSEAVAGQHRMTAHEYVREAVRSAILRGSLPGGTRLIQADLASELGVSTTPVREALRDLATDGLITLDAHRGAVVKQLTYPELEEIQSLMRLLEPEAMRRAAALRGGDAGQLALAETCARRMVDETDVGRWVDLNREFHELLISPFRDSRLHGILQGLRDAVAPYIALALRQQGYQLELANEHHRALVDAVRAGDSVTAEGLARDHVDLTTKALAASQQVFASAPTSSE